MDHLGQLFISLAHERQRLADASTDEERELRSVWVSQLEREINAEERFVGVAQTDFTAESMPVEEIFAALDEFDREIGPGLDTASARA